MADKLQLKKKDITAIRKASRVLRDPGTTNFSSRRPRASNASPPPPPLPQLLNHATDADANVVDAAPKKPVFLYNWKQHNLRSSGEKSNHNDTLSSLASSTSNSAHSRRRNSKSDTCIPRRRASIILRCRDTTTIATPTMRRALVLAARNKQLKKTSSSIGDTSEDASPLLPRLRNNNTAFRISSRKEDTSSYACSTPALSTASLKNPYALTNPSAVGSWDATTASFDDTSDPDGDATNHIELPARQGCGIPCYWSKRTPPKYKGASTTCYSPSLSYTLRRKGGSILCGTQTMYSRHRRHSKRKVHSRSAQASCQNGYDSKAASSSIGTGRSDDELSANYGELDLEALSRLDGRRWSTSCRSQQGSDIMAANGDNKGQGTPDSIMSLSNKYRPMFFSELIGQNLVVQSLTNAISRCRIAPVYLFQGSRGTGKTSTARIFAAALNCMATVEPKPCGNCRPCNIYISGESKHYVEVDATDNKMVDQVRHLWRGISKESALSAAPYKIFVIEECHLLPSKTWLTFLKVLEDPPTRVVFIFITTDLDCVPRAILSRCQKFHFNKLKDGDIVDRLSKITAEEGLDVEPDALDLIALNTDGSLRDAETMLDQLSLLGRKITVSLVHELVGVVSDEKLLELLELAMSAETAKTVKKAKELMDSGLDPVVLTSQLASLIMDLIAGTYQIEDAVPTDLAPGVKSLTEAELERLKVALKLLSEAEKQLRISNDRGTWFTATLLQLGSALSVDLPISSTSRKQSSKTTEEDLSTSSIEACSNKPISSDQIMCHKSIPSGSFQRADDKSQSYRKEASFLVESPISKSTRRQLVDGNMSIVSKDDAMLGHAMAAKIDSNKLDYIWRRCIEKCHSNTLKQLLYTHGMLASLFEEKGVLVAYIAFRDADIKSRAERFLSSIMNSFEIVLRCNVEIKMILLSNDMTSIHEMKPANLPENLPSKHIGKREDNEWKQKPADKDKGDGPFELQKPLQVSPGSFNSSVTRFHDNSVCDPIGLPVESTEVQKKLNDAKGRKQRAPMQRIESIIREQRLETAWLQAVEKSSSGSMSRTRPDKNQVLPQDGIHHSMESLKHTGAPSQELILSEADEGGAFQMDQYLKRSDHQILAPSLLHDKRFAQDLSKDNMGYDSGPATRRCSGFFCWSSSKPPKGRGKVTQETGLETHTGGRFICFGNCCTSRRKDTCKT